MDAWKMRWLPNSLCRRGAVKPSFLNEIYPVMHLEQEIAFTAKILGKSIKAQTGLLETSHMRK